ncbi:MAG: hypothetical protein AAGJ95_09515 [Cyanobacteria bacterium J06554_11]
MNTAQIAHQAKITEHRLGVIARQLWGELPAELSGDQIAQVEQVADYMRDNGLKSVKTAIAEMRSNAAQDSNHSASQPGVEAYGRGGGLHEQFLPAIDAASDQLADFVDAAIIQRTLQKVGTGEGRFAQVAVENFTQAIVPVFEMNDQGLQLVGSNPSTPSLPASQTE